MKEAEGDPWMGVNDKYHVGQTVEGTVEKKEQFGYFIALEPGITGLLPKSNIQRSSKPALIERLLQGDTLRLVNDRDVRYHPVLNQNLRGRLITCQASYTY